MDEMKEKSVALLVAEKPERARIFDRYGIDYCCAGAEKLSAACLQKGIEIEHVIGDLLASDNSHRGDEPARNWLDASVCALIDDIEHNHHAYLKRELPRLEALAVKVLQVHGGREKRLEQLVSIYSTMKRELLLHMQKEEAVLFPYMRELEKSGRKVPAVFGSVTNPIRCMQSEHEDAGETLALLRQLTDDYQPPAAACPSWQALYAGLAAVDLDLRRHVHKENFILFPRAILLEKEGGNLLSACRPQCR